MTQEILQVGEKSTSPGLMARLTESFGNGKWQYRKDFAKRKGEFFMWMESGNGKRTIECVDFGKGPEGSTVQISFYEREDELKFTLRQVVEIVDDKPVSIENHILVAPFLDRNFDPEWGYGIHYRPGGEMSPRRRVKGLPLKIDMDATVTAFIEQVIAVNFGRPQLFRPKK